MGVETDIVGHYRAVKKNSLHAERYNRLVDIISQGTENQFIKQHSLTLKQPGPGGKLCGRMGADEVEVVHEGSVWAVFRGELLALGRSDPTQLTHQTARKICDKHVFMPAKFVDACWGVAKKAIMQELGLPGGGAADEVPPPTEPTGHSSESDDNNGDEAISSRPGGPSSEALARASALPSSHKPRAAAAAAAGDAEAAGVGGVAEPSLPGSVPAAAGAGPSIAAAAPAGPAGPVQVTVPPEGIVFNGNVSYTIKPESVGPCRHPGVQVFLAEAKRRPPLAVYILSRQLFNEKEGVMSRFVDTVHGKGFRKVTGPCLLHLDKPDLYAVGVPRYEKTLEVAAQTMQPEVVEEMFGKLVVLVRKLHKLGLIDINMVPDNVFYDENMQTPVLGGLLSYRLLEPEALPGPAASGCSSAAGSGSNKRARSRLHISTGGSSPLPSSSSRSSSSRHLSTQSLAALSAVSRSLAVIAARLFKLRLPAADLTPSTAQEVLQITSALMQKVQFAAAADVELPCSYDMLSLVNHLAKGVCAPGNLVGMAPALMSSDELQSYALRFVHAMHQDESVKNATNYNYVFRADKTPVMDLQLHSVMGRLPRRMQQYAVTDRFDLPEGHSSKARRLGGLATFSGGSGGGSSSRGSGSRDSGSRGSGSRDSAGASARQQSGATAGEAGQGELPNWGDVPDAHNEHGKVFQHLYLQKLRNCYGHNDHSAHTITKLVKQLVPNLFAGMFEIVHGWKLQDLPEGLKGLSVQPHASDVFAPITADEARAT